MLKWSEMSVHACKIKSRDIELDRAGRGELLRELHQSDFNQPSHGPKLREKSRNKKNSGIAFDLHRMNDGDTENVSEIRGIEKNNEKR